MTDFSWVRSDAGYAWEKLAPAVVKSPVLTARRAWPTATYRPLEEVTGLFVLFADLEPVPERILEFAGRYGHLGEFLWVEGHALDPLHARDTEVLNAPLLSRIGGSSENVGAGRPETLSLWQTEIGRMKEAVGLWRGVRGGQADPARLEDVCTVANRVMDGRVAPAASYDPKRRTCSLGFRPLDLIGAMWLQLADAIAAGKEPRECPVCSTWFVVDAGRARTDKQHCSLGCRQKAYRNRRQQALDLHAKRVPASEIAEQVGSDLKTVKRWLKAASDGGGQTDGAGTPQGRPGLDL